LPSGGEFTAGEGSPELPPVRPAYRVYTLVRNVRRVPGKACAQASVLQVHEIDGDFKTRAEVRNIAIGPDGHPRLNLLFLDSSAPERMLPGIGADEAKGPQ
jgi:hypothetical protein